MKDHYISASDIAEYCYCERAWWHRLEGTEKEHKSELAVGEQAHQAAAAQVVQSQRTFALGRALLWVGAALLVIVIIVWIVSPR
jgi:CRISPR/Cas system-associated exonuclease Cas4 (RecB family)